MTRAMFFRQADPPGERNDRWSKRADLFDPSYLSDSDSVDIKHDDRTADSG